MSNKISVEEISEMSYTGFVGFINQWNVLPGAYTTLSKWIHFADIDSDSIILEVACTTGFSSREIALLTGCSGKGFDLSEPSIDAARKNKEVYAPDVDLEYFVKDGYDFSTDEKFSHIILGASLGFFPNPEKMVNICVQHLEEEGLLLASPFYVTKDMPEDLIEEFVDVFDIQPTTKSYKEIMRHYRNFEILYEDRNKLVPETEEELDHYCNSTVDRICKEKSIDDVKVRKAIYDRLYRIKEMSNALRPYQQYSVLVLRYRKQVYPNRYVELF